MKNVWEVCVTPFDLSTTRQSLFENFSIVYRRFEEAGVGCDLWLDGSFATKSLNPKDLDVVARVPAELYNEPLDSEARQILEWFCLSEELKDDLGIDAYMFPEFPQDSPHHSTTEERVRYWEDLFSTGRDNSTEKGIIVVQVNGGVK